MAKLPDGQLGSAHDGGEAVLTGREQKRDSDSRSPRTPDQLPAIGLPNNLVLVERIAHLSQGLYPRLHRVVRRHQAPGIGNSNALRDAIETEGLAHLASGKTRPSEQH